MTEEYEESSDLTTDKVTIYSMYKIIPKNKELNYCYIGHTNNFFTPLHI